MDKFESIKTRFWCRLQPSIPYHSLRHFIDRLHWILKQLKTAIFPAMRKWSQIHEYIWYNTYIFIFISWYTNRKTSINHVVNFIKVTQRDMIFLMFKYLQIIDTLTTIYHFVICHCFCCRKKINWKSSNLRASLAYWADLLFQLVLFFVN